MLGPNRPARLVTIRLSVAESSMKTASPASSFAATALRAGTVTPSEDEGSSDDTATISNPPSSVGRSTIPAAEPASRRACSATTESASSASPPDSSAVVTATDPSIQCSRCRAASYSRALPMAIPASVASTRTMWRS